MRTERVENVLYYDISQGDGDADMTHTTSSGVQTINPTTSSYGAQTSNPTTSSYGAQTSNPTTSSSETQTIRITTKEHGSQSQATEDRSEEIEKIKTRQ